MDNFPGTSSRAIGILRCLYIRVTYPDQMAQPNTEQQAYADMRDNARFYLENSYGKLTQTTTVTPVLTLPRTVAWYKAKDAEVDGLGLVHNDSRAAAKSAGYDRALVRATFTPIDTWKELADALQQTGMTADEAALVMGGNMARVAQQNAHAGIQKR